MYRRFDGSISPALGICAVNSTWETETATYLSTQYAWLPQLMNTNPSHSHCSVTKWWMKERLKMNWIPKPDCIQLPHVQKAQAQSQCSQSNLKILLFENRPDSTSGLWTKTMRRRVAVWCNQDGQALRIKSFGHQRPALKDNLLNSSSLGWEKGSLQKMYPLNIS